jgi:acetyl-CoA carboxylase biotin carboxyl carrier protein
MVGTFYAAASPDADPFVAAGSTLAEGDVVCLIEAMKIFNEIKAEVGGTLERVLVKNGDAVEFGQELMLVRPA